MFFAVVLFVMAVAITVEGVAFFLGGDFLEEEGHFIRLFRVALLAPDQVAEKEANTKNHSGDETDKKQGCGAVSGDERALARPEVRHRLLIHLHETIDHDESEDEGTDDQGEAIPGEIHEQAVEAPADPGTVAKYTNSASVLNPKIKNIGKAADLRIVSAKKVENPAGPHFWQVAQRP